MHLKSQHVVMAGAALVLALPGLAGCSEAPTLEEGDASAQRADALAEPVPEAADTRAAPTGEIAGVPKEVATDESLMAQRPALSRSSADPTGPAEAFEENSTQVEEMPVDHAAHNMTGMTAHDMSER